MNNVNITKLIGRNYNLRRLASSYSSSDVRNIFLNYFKENDHKFVRSSPVVPLYDPSVAFVNAGMNQFKGVFLGKVTSPYKRAVNSQKCVRVGGKHNDLSVVGKDGYHHTFFEMLGNWSFGDYFKEDACRLAWNLLNGPLGIDPNRLYVTYFGGDKDLNLPADIECYNIWRELGVSKDRILPFGLQDNFWEMGATGPCGPCTEIHIDHKTSGSAERAKFVNAGRDDLTELWNVVFIQYNRNEDGSIISLPEKHVDTGMGFERLTAILQNKSTNYDTDLFTPLFHTIEKVCTVPAYSKNFDENSSQFELDTAYRVLVDHSRMITACLSDGMLPDQNQKLRRILRKCFILSENVFNRKHLLLDIVPKVVDILGPTYIEMERNLSATLDIIAHEHEVYKSLRESSAEEFKKIAQNHPQFENVHFTDYPGFIPAFKELQECKTDFTDRFIPGDFLFKLYDTYGLDYDIIKKMADLENLRFHEKTFEEELTNIKMKGKTFSYYENSNFNPSVLLPELKGYVTDNNFKYEYEYNPKQSSYQIQPVKAKILAIFKLNDTIYHIVTDKSNFYYESGGQEMDKGLITKSTSDGSIIEFNVSEVHCVNGCVVHSGTFSGSEVFEVNDNVLLLVDENRRTAITLHHTATHLLNASVRSICKRVTYQISSSVTEDNLKLELGILGAKINKEDVGNIENFVRNVIYASLPVETNEISAHEAINMNDIVTVPGEVYPEVGLRLLTSTNEELGFKSKELCCGTHARNTSELRNFYITNFKQTSRGKYLFNAVAGEAAGKAAKIAEEVAMMVSKIEIAISERSDAYDRIENNLQRLKGEITFGDITLPFLLKIELLEKINILFKILRENSRMALREILDMEMKNLLERKPVEKHPFIIHCLESSSLLESVSLQKATRFCRDRPIIVISMAEGLIKARCCVPKSKVNENFSALKWLSVFAKVFNAHIAPPKGKDPHEVCNMKPKKVVPHEFDDQLELAIEMTKAFAKTKLK